MKGRAGKRNRLLGTILYILPLLLILFSFTILPSATSPLDTDSALIGGDHDRRDELVEPGNNANPKNSKNGSYTIGTLTIPAGYDKLILPTGGGVSNETLVNVQLGIREVLGVDTKGETVELDTEVGVSWIDWDIWLNFMEDKEAQEKAKTRDEEIILDSEVLRHIWKPDIYIGPFTIVVILSEFSINSEWRSPNVCPQIWSKLAFGGDICIKRGENAPIRLTNFSFSKFTADFSRFGCKYLRQTCALGDEMASVDRTSILSKLITLRFLVNNKALPGIISFKSRQTLKLRCDMDFHYYPADIQTCEYNIRSYSYTQDKLFLMWDLVHSIYLDKLADSNFDFQISSAEPQWARFIKFWPKIYMSRI
ncbi:Gamma-aminobutyric acid receptor subunit rho-1 [Folsomia candida]|uniref:Gamma-aminobutyric acid receptor subunit rho-1 n=1 Tax=Folsomia candida TaxID=158441 RepID=A0A226DM23_FOLCA|nr:Gamma-aminobutyric acid receptor subunit rho-1 [Folsomia candida]